MDYFKDLSAMFLKIEATDERSKTLPLGSAIQKVIDLVTSRAKTGGKVIFIGNGGSASISSHMAIDFLKNGDIPALTFNDPAFLTCISNDLGYEQVFRKPIEVLAKKNDILFSISSSGKSKNITNATEEAKNKGCLVITLTGFNKDNPLRKMGDINFYVPSGSYGYVEITHLAVCHFIIDEIIANKNG